MQFILNYFHRSISATLLFIGIAALLSACGGGSSGTPRTSVTALTLSPQTVQFDKGDTYKFTASLSSPSGSAEDVSDKVSWTSSNETVASVDSSGLVSGLSAGTTTITVVYQGKKAYTVTDGVTITEPEPDTAQASEQSVTANAGAPNISGKEAKSAPTTPNQHNVHANSLHQLSSKKATLAVSDAILESITVTPASTTIAAGYAQQYTATAIYSDASTQDITNIVSWSANDSELDINDMDGLVTTPTDAAGELIYISASLGELISNPAKLRVSSAILESITIESPNADSDEMPARSELQFAAIGHFSDGSILDLTNACHWSIVEEFPDDIDVSVGEISNDADSIGRLNTFSPGTLVVGATLGAMNAEYPVAVNNAVLTGLSLNPPAVAIPTNSQQQLSLIAYYSDNTSRDVSDAVKTVWSSSDSNIATVGNAGKSGLVISQDAVASTTITATYLDQTSPTILTVTPAVLESISLSELSPLALDSSQQISATGHYSDDSTRDISNQVTWFSTTGNVILSNANGSRGLATAMSEGRDIVSARFNGIETSGELIAN
ncbi:Ig-like domain-containing protein [Zhongshania borealis]|uniref:BIG2 domain-containing protein n=1 Tax=Zhongshania borealis TaxID=889488 RepID=A0ABP7WLM1_9GAMM